MTPDDLAALHAACFTRPPPWPSDGFTALLDSPGVFLLSRPAGFLMGRVVAEEAELLTLAVDPAARRQGIGRGLAEAFERRVAGQGARCAFLEVASDNGPAQALYRALGWTVEGRRRAYYGAGVDALVMRRLLG